MAAGVAPGLEVIADHDRVEADGLGVDREVEQFAGRELFRRGLVAEFEHRGVPLIRVRNACMFTCGSDKMARAACVEGLCSLPYRALRGMTNDQVRCVGHSSRQPPLLAGVGRALVPRSLEHPERALQRAVAERARCRRRRSACSRRRSSSIPRSRRAIAITYGRLELFARAARPLRAAGRADRRDLSERSRPADALQIADQAIEAVRSVGWRAIRRSSTSRR